MHWPNEAARAATWNTKLLDQMGSAWGQEMFYFGSDLLLATCLNIQRHPLGGRNFEYYSEDPYLTGKVAAAEINGIQSQGVGATIKHLFAYDQETNRMNLPVQLSTRAAREIYLPGYEIAIKESNPWAMMTSYNSTNGVATAQNPELIAQIVRGEWGFDGISMTDWGGYGNLLYWPATQAGSNAYSGLVKAGNDLCMNTGSATDVKAGLDAGFITQADIDACVQRILEFVVKTPAFKGNSKSSAPDTDKNMDLAVDVAVEAMTLLKNEKVNEISALPIKSSEVTMIGTTASALFRGGKGSGDVNPDMNQMLELPDALSAAGIKVTNLTASPAAAQLDQLTTKPAVTVMMIKRQVTERADFKADKGYFNLTDEEQSLITSASAICPCGRQTVHHGFEYGYPDRNRKLEG